MRCTRRPRRSGALSGRWRALTLCGFGSRRLFFDAMDPQDIALTCLTSAQRVAWRHVEETIRDRQADARVRLTNIFRSSGCNQAEFDAATESVRRHARVVLH